MMMWVLIVLNLSSWNGNVIGTNELGQFADKNDCYAERSRLEASMDGADARMVCVERKRNDSKEGGNNGH